MGTSLLSHQSYIYLYECVCLCAGARARACVGKYMCRNLLLVHGIERMHRHDNQRNMAETVTRKRMVFIWVLNLFMWSKCFTNLFILISISCGYCFVIRCLSRTSEFGCSCFHETWLIVLYLGVLVSMKHDILSLFDCSCFNETRHIILYLIVLVSMKHSISLCISTYAERQFDFQIVNCPTF